jgi:hypothetical protein
LATQDFHLPVLDPSHCPEGQGPPNGAARHSREKMMRYWGISAFLWALSAPSLSGPALAHTAHHAAHVTHHAKKSVAHHMHHSQATNTKVGHGHGHKTAHHAVVSHHPSHASHARSHAHLAHLSRPQKVAAPSEPGDHSAEDLNARSLDAVQSGQAYSPQ